MHRPQLELLLSIVLAAGGAVNLSDNLPRLNASGIDLARRVVSAESMPAAIPLDLLHSELPSYWIQQGTKHCRILLVNWQDIPQERRIDLSQHGINSSQATNFWNDQQIAIRDNLLTAVIEPRSCLLAVI